jgi:hypothetical protein
MAERGGVRPNSGRKPKDEENRIRDLMKPHSEEAIKCLVNIMTDDKARSSDRISASKLIIEYTYGKPKETIDTNHTFQSDNIKELFKIDSSK